MSSDDAVHDGSTKHDGMESLEHVEFEAPPSEETVVVPPDPPAEVSRAQTTRMEVTQRR
mgnify:CR=1 FL=1